MWRARWRVMSVAIVAVGCGDGEDVPSATAGSVTSSPMEGATITRSSMTSTVSSGQVPEPTRPGSAGSGPASGSEFASGVARPDHGTTATADSGES